MKPAGPKCSAFMMILGVWGLIMLALLGAFAKVHAVALIEDIPIDHNEWAAKNHSMTYLDEKFNITAINCFAAAGLYLLLLIIGAINYRLNQRGNYVTH